MFHPNFTTRLRLRSPPTREYDLPSNDFRSNLLMDYHIPFFNSLKENFSFFFHID